MRLFYILSILALSVYISNAAPITTDFTYDDKEVESFAAISYNLFLDGTMICSVPVSAATEVGGELTISCETEISPGHHLFSMTVSMVNKRATQHSNQFPYYQPPVDLGEPNAPILIKVTVAVESNGAVVERVE